MTCGLLNATYSLPEWQAVKQTFFATCIGYFEATRRDSNLLFSAKSLWVGNITKSKTSKGNSTLLPANVDHLLRFTYINLYT